MKGPQVEFGAEACPHLLDRKSTRLNSSHLVISYAVFCLKKYSTAPLARPPEPSQKGSAGIPEYPAYGCPRSSRTSPPKQHVPADRTASDCGQDPLGDGRN